MRIFYVKMSTSKMGGGGDGLHILGCERSTTFNDAIRLLWYHKIVKPQKYGIILFCSCINVAYIGQHISRSHWLFYAGFFLCLGAFALLVYYKAFRYIDNLFIQHFFIYSSKVCFYCTRLAIGCTIKTYLGWINKKPWMNKFSTCRKAL